MIFASIVHYLYFISILLNKLKYLLKIYQVFRFKTLNWIKNINLCEKMRFQKLADTIDVVLVPTLNKKWTF